MTLVYDDASALRRQGASVGIAGEVERRHGRVHVTRNGRDYVVLLAAEDLESIGVTLEPLADPEDAAPAA